MLQSNPHVNNPNYAPDLGGGGNGAGGGMQQLQQQHQQQQQLQLVTPFSFPHAPVPLESFLTNFSQLSSSFFTPLLSKTV